MSSGMLVLERLIEMLDEKGLSSYRYEHIRSDYFLEHRIDISKDGKKLATWDTQFLFRYSEDDMQKKLDELVRKSGA